MHAVLHSWSMEEQYCMQGSYMGMGRFILSMEEQYCKAYWYMGGSCGACKCSTARHIICMGIGHCNVVYG